jgi:phospholipid/cholesterol/gamma-HCH transport system substrate-binding protein
MFGAKTRIQLVVFLLIAGVGVTYAGGKYAGLDRMFGGGGYVVRLELADSGGIFSNAEVSYRGVTVGRVGPLRITDSGVEVDLDIADDAPQIPADTSAVVADRSAVGEQYVDLEPRGDHPPYLGAGSVITADRTSLPPRPEGVLTNLDQLVSSVPTDSLRTVVDQADIAFSGTGPQLQTLLDDVMSLSTTAIQHLPQTTNLLSQSETVLRRQAQDAALIGNFSSGLRQISGRLKDSDPDLRRLIDVAPRAAQQVDEILRSSGPQLGVLLANLLTTTRITTSRKDAVEQLLVELPVITAMAPGMGDDQDTGHQAFIFNYGDPLSCTKGYESTPRRPANDLTPAPANMNAYCAEPPGSPTDVRGAQNAPFPGMPPAPAVPSSPSSPAVPAGLDRVPGPIGLLDPGGSPTNFAQLLGLPG